MGAVGMAQVDDHVKLEREPLGNSIWLVVVWLLGMAVVEGELAWHLTKIGEGMYPPVIKVSIVGGLLCCVGLGCLALIDRRLMTRGGRMPDLAKRVMVEAGVLVVCLAVVSYFFVQPLQVRSWNPRLIALLHCAGERQDVCPHKGTTVVPGLGRVLWTGITLESGQHPVGYLVLASAEAISGDSWDEDTARAYIYAPGESPLAFASNGMCIRHIYGPWWESGNDGAGDCPSGGYGNGLAP
jgi:hypothetical protein